VEGSKPGGIKGYRRLPQRLNGTSDLERQLEIATKASGILIIPSSRRDVLHELWSGSPVVAHRNGTDFQVTANQMNVDSGTEMRVEADRKDLHLSQHEMDKGSSVIFKLTGFTKADSGKKVEGHDPHVDCYARLCPLLTTAISAFYALRKSIYPSTAHRDGVAGPSGEFPLGSCRSPCGVLN
jgi:hypothetical protein